MRKKTSWFKSLLKRWRVCGLSLQALSRFERVPIKTYCKNGIHQLYLLIINFNFNFSSCSCCSLVIRQKSDVESFLSHGILS
jgi:hypothetical protein